MFTLQVIYCYSSDDIDHATIAASHNRDKLQQIIDKVEQVQKPVRSNNMMRYGSYFECADNWTEKVSEILDKAQIPSACHPEWDTDLDVINFVINEVVEV